jgi:8-oxo-dGTP diphosphatase
MIDLNPFDPNHHHSTAVFVVGQKVVIFNELDEVLFLRRSSKTDRAGGWDFPGGRLELEDTDPVEGIRREVWEETQLKVSDIRPVAVVTRAANESKQGLLVVGYKARLESGAVILSWEHDQFQWLSSNDALKVELPDHHRMFLEKALK